MPDGEKQRSHRSLIDSEQARDFAGVLQFMPEDRGASVRQEIAIERDSPVAIASGKVRQ